MGRTINFKGITARPSSILIDLRCCGLKQVTYPIDPSPKNLAYAARIRAEIIGKFERGTLVIEDYFPKLRQTNDTFNEFADQWLRIVKPKLAETTLGEYSNSLNRFRNIWGNRRLVDLTAEDIVTFLASIDLTAKTESPRESWRPIGLSNEVGN